MSSALRKKLDLDRKIHRKIRNRDLSIIRRKVATAARLIGLSPEEAEYIADELFANAKLHGKGKVRIHLQISKGRSSLEVINFAQKRELGLFGDKLRDIPLGQSMKVDFRDLTNPYDFDDPLVGGRGLCLICELCDRNSVEVVQMITRARGNPLVGIRLNYPHSNPKSIAR
ncbi:hypothetical protein COY62_03030 [bacterium (Candidatus Howlettbacteria) CG_4_10_14_0_8_um_filter_40_9]|nr:MAG: hypothetical protein COY62_03030 [bacterium (Candidatus Howlettbacteria) CG_4_10_14_0_8_um_filter_40_9]